MKAVFAWQIVKLIKTLDVCAALMTLRIGRRRLETFGVHGSDLSYLQGSDNTRMKALGRPVGRDICRSGLEHARRSWYNTALGLVL